MLFRSLKMAPKLLPKAKKMEDVPIFEFDRNIMHTHRKNEEQGVPYNTAVSNKKRCRKILIDALNKIGTPKHQAFILYDVLTDPERINIGVALGLVHRPDKTARAIRQVIEAIREFLHSEYVLEQQTNESKSAQMNLFMYAGCTAPPDARTNPKAKRKLQKAISDFSHLFELPRCAKKRLVEAAFIRAEVLGGSFSNPELVRHYKRKSTCIINDHNKAVMKTWLETLATTVQPSPNQRDSIQVKNEDGQVVGKERRYLYAGGKREVFDEACKAIEKGDLELVMHEGDEHGIGREVLESIGRTTFERLLPKNLGQMSDAHKEQMVCGICQDAQWAFEARNRSLLTRLEYYDKLLTKFPQGHPVHQKIRRDKKKFVNEALKKDEDGEWVPKFDTLNEFYLSMCCKSVSENDWEVPYECLLGKCDECPEMERYFGEHVESVTEGPNVVKWKQNRVSYFCPNHGFIAYNSGKCPKCDQSKIPQKDRPPPRKEIGRASCRER